MPRLDHSRLADLLMPRRGHEWGRTSDAELRRALGSGALHRVRRGWYIAGAAWSQLWPEDRHVLHVLAVAKDADRGGGVMSHMSAAVLWGLPLYRVVPAAVHMIVKDPHTASGSTDVCRHRQQLAEADIVRLHGIACTSLARTVFDVARTATPEAAVSAADAALRLVAWHDSTHTYETGRARAWKENVAALGRAAGAIRGIRQSRWVAEFADGRAQLPGESASRLQLVRLGFRFPSLQVLVRGPQGEDWWIDFGLDDVSAFGEFDGKGKYRDADMLAGRSIEEAVLAEKMREDWIRGTTQRRFARWGAEHIRTPGALGQRLARFGIAPGR